MSNSAGNQHQGEDTTASSEDTQSKSFAGTARRLVGELGLLLVIVIFMVVMSILSPVFLSIANLRNLVIQSTILAVLALGETYVIIARGIDLSVGSVMAVSSALGLGVIVYNGFPVVGGIAVSILVGIAFGLFNGWAVTRVGVTPLIVTLAALSMGRGIVFVYTNGANITPVPEMFVTLGTASILGVPVSVLVLVGLAVVAHLILARTVFGRQVYATGGNELAARLAGIATRRVQTLTYVISGVTAAIAGIILTSRLQSAGPRAGVGIELTVIATCVIGGTSLFGGQGKIFGTLLGVLLISLVSNAINLLGVPPAWDNLVTGIVIFVAAVVDVYRRRYTTGSEAAG